MSAPANVVDLKGGKYKCAKEVAEAEFDRLCQMNRIDLDVSELSEKDLESWNAQRAAIVKDIRRGTLIISEDGRPTYTPPGSSKGYTFYPPTGASLMAMETYGSDKQTSNILAVIAEMTRSDRSDFGKMSSIDVKACVRLGTLFLGEE